MKRDTLFDAVYRDWLSGFVPWKGRSGARNCHDILQFLYENEYHWDAKRFPLDQNRALDGMFLRRDFLAERPDLADEFDEKRPCSWLEMLVALAIRVDSEYIGDPCNSDAGPFFWEMVTNFDRSFSKKMTSKLTSCHFLPLNEDPVDLDVWSRMLRYLSEKH